MWVAELTAKEYTDIHHCMARLKYIPDITMYRLRTRICNRNAQSQGIIGTKFQTGLRDGDDRVGV